MARGPSAEVSDTAGVALAESVVLACAAASNFISVPAQLTVVLPSAARAVIVTYGGVDQPKAWPKKVKPAPDAAQLPWAVASTLGVASASR